MGLGFTTGCIKCGTPNNAVLRARCHACGEILRPREFAFSREEFAGLGNDEGDADKADRDFKLRREDA